MQFRQQPQSMLWKIAFLIIALVGNVSCIRNSDGNDEQKHISVKLKNFFPSEQVSEVHPPIEAQASQSQVSARVTNGGFKPSQMLEFTPSDVINEGANRYPPSYLEPNYKFQVPSSLANHQSAMDKQFAFPDDGQTTYHSFGNAQIPTTPVVSYLDQFTQQNYRYTPTSTPAAPIYVQYQREQPVNHNDQAYTVQSSLLVGNHSPQKQRPGSVDDVYLKRPGYVFDESPSSAYRRPSTTTSTIAKATSASPGHKISYDSHDYPPPSYATQQTSNFVAQPQPPRPPAPQRPQPQQARPTPPSYRPPYNRQDVTDNRPLAGPSIHEAAYASQPQFSSSSNYANNFGNYLQRPPGYPSQSHTQTYSPSQYNPTHYQYESPVRETQQQYQQQHQQLQRPGHNYYEYQIGEIPPQQSPQQPQHQYNYHPGPAPAYRPPSHSANEGLGGGGGGLATLASLLSSTQQYAPQFTNLLLGGGGAGGGSGAASSVSPLGSLLGAFTGQQQHTRPPNMQLIRALENIARNDDLQCVPKVLCQMIAGQTLRGQLPGFITSPAITNFLAGFPVASPALIYGRAALLGISGGERSCVKTYERCPKNEMEIIHYLNNHRGGFFKFFSEPEEQSAEAQQSESGGASFLSILSALTGGGQGLGQGQVTRTTPRPVPRPTQRPSTDIADGIGSFFTRVLSEYLNGVEYQRRRRRRRSLLPTEIKRNIQTDNGRLMAVDFHDEEDDLDTQTIVKFQDDDEAEAAKAHTELIGVLQFPEAVDESDGEGRILHFKNIESEEHNHHGEGAVRFPDATPEVQRENERKVINDFNRVAAQRKLRFPQEQEKVEREAKKLELAESWSAVLPNGLGVEEYGVNKRRGKRIVFKDTNEDLEDLDERLREEEQEEERRFREDQLREEQIRNIQLREEQRKQQHTPLNALYEEAAPPQRGARVIFPDHYERHIRKGKILNRPTYAPSYEYNNEVRPEEKEERLVVSDDHRPNSYYRLETSDYQTNAQSQGFMNYGEYMPGNNVRFVEPLDRPNYSSQYNYPNANYISDDRYSSAYQITSTRSPKHEDNKNIYVTNSQGITEYYIRPDGQKVYLGSG